MGDPKKQRKKYETPKYPFNKGQLDTELKIIGEYGLRNKRELWRHHTSLSRYRTTARRLLVKTSETRAAEEKLLLSKLFSIGLIPENATLDDVLDLSIKDILERRLQTVALRQRLAKTPQQARQLIVHGHLSIKGRRVTSPSHIVKRDEESILTYATESPYSGADHILRKSLASTTQP